MDSDGSPAEFSVWIDSRYAGRLRTADVLDLSRSWSIAHLSMFLGDIRQPLQSKLQGVRGWALSCLTNRKNYLGWLSKSIGS